MSVEQKHNVMVKNSGQERANLDGGELAGVIEPVAETTKSSSSSGSEDEMTSDSDTGGKGGCKTKYVLCLLCITYQKAHFI